MPCSSSESNRNTRRTKRRRISRRRIRKIQDMAKHVSIHFESVAWPQATWRSCCCREMMLIRARIALVVVSDLT
jgi:hypothetical protein